MIDSHDIHVGADAYEETGEQVIPGVTFAYFVITFFGAPARKYFPEFKLEVGVPLSLIRRAMETRVVCETMRATNSMGQDVQLDPESELVQGLVTMNLRMEDAAWEAMTGERMLPDIVTIEDRELAREMTAAGFEVL